MNKKEYIAHLKAEAQMLFRMESELHARREQIEKQLNQLQDEQAIKRAKGELCQ